MFDEFLGHFHAFCSIVQKNCKMRTEHPKPRLTRHDINVRKITTGNSNK